MHSLDGSSLARRLGRAAKKNPLKPLFKRSKSTDALYLTPAFDSENFHTGSCYLNEKDTSLCSSTCSITSVTSSQSSNGGQDDVPVPLVRKGRSVGAVEARCRRHLGSRPLTSSDAALLPRTRSLYEGRMSSRRALTTTRLPPPPLPRLKTGHPPFRP